jgi:hypothetical protein
MHDKFDMNVNLVKFFQSKTCWRKKWAISLVGVDDEGYVPCSINHHLCVHHKSFHET